MSFCSGNGATVERTLDPELPADDFSERYDHWETAVERFRDWASLPAAGPE